MGNGDGAAAAPFDGLELGDTSLAAAFAEADLNADGNLDRAEVVALWVDYEENAILETPRNCKQIKRIVKRFDLDDVQGLNLDEFSNLVDYVYVEPEEGDEDPLTKKKVTSRLSWTRVRFSTIPQMTLTAMRGPMRMLSTEEVPTADENVTIRFRL